jgi:hypothetical protein
MRKWTLEERQRQRELIRKWQPWKKAGVKTPEGKAKSKMNALKHGAYSAETKATRYLLRECRDLIIFANQYIRALRQFERLEKAITLKNKGSHLAKNSQIEERINKTVSPVNAFPSLRATEGSAAIQLKNKQAPDCSQSLSPRRRGLAMTGKEKNSKIAERINKTEGCHTQPGPNHRSDYRAIWGDYPILSPPRMPWDFHSVIANPEMTIFLPPAIIAKKSAILVPPCPSRGLAAQSGKYLPLGTARPRHEDGVDKSSGGKNDVNLFLAFQR